MAPARNPLTDLLARKGVLLADGATGTNLFAAGLEAGEAPEIWNEAHPERITKLHQDFVDAGADIILTNSFGGTRHRLKLHHAQDRVFAINKAAAEIARAVADKAGREVIVAGSVGPTGELLLPLGALSYEDAVAAFVEQMEGLKAGGVDVAWIETMSSPEEIRAAAEAAVKIGLPYTYTGSFDTAGKTMMGLDPKDIHGVAADIGAGPVAVGANCGVGASDILSSLLDMTNADPNAVVIVKGNCGIPEYRGAEIYYSGTPPLMADYARLARDAGAKIIGGCCGTSCDHLAAMRQAIDSYTPGPRPTIETIVERIGPLRNKTAAESGAAPPRERGRRRG
ncbi:betaine--homocysteine S-methyltransferase [Rhizobium sp. BK251]|uniref:betaine--homocysteine S-methyltransferase n=1 Tax=Rhizobium sp. BK251 TaxID=2512125 RepID=UPI0010486058|nr:betaine--homocysteine S-methyltransferase [Rhizobium sp. BK251]TCL73873.1 5-methyltetrahydrofolate--homocysteine methyltransferase [Rhizobium sp. BK251]